MGIGGRENKKRGRLLSHVGYDNVPKLTRPWRDRTGRTGQEVKPTAQLFPSRHKPACAADEAIARFSHNCYLCHYTVPTWSTRSKNIMTRWTGPFRHRSSFPPTGWCRQLSTDRSKTWLLIARYTSFEDWYWGLAVCNVLCLSEEKRRDGGKTQWPQCSHACVRAIRLLLAT